MYVHIIADIAQLSSKVNCHFHGPNSTVYNMTTNAIGDETVKLTDRLSDSGSHIGSGEGSYRSNAAAHAHQRACVLRRNVHVIDVVARVDEAGKLTASTSSTMANAA